jgi:hypothetical protein
MNRISAAALIGSALLLGVGCSGTAPTTTQPGANPVGGAGVSKNETKATDPNANPAGLSKTAADLLNKIKSGTATGTILTADFKKHFAPPELASDEAVGYSESAATLNLKLLGNEIGTDLVNCEVLLGDKAYVLANGKTIGTPGTTMVRLAYTGGEWKIDWLATAPVGFAVKTLQGESLPSQFTALALVHAVMTRQFRLAEGLLTESGKATLGKSTFGNEFDRGALKNKLEELFGLIETYTVAATSKSEVIVQYTVVGKARKATIKLDGDAKVTGVTVE